jgi:hypothetical protein
VTEVHVIADERTTWRVYESDSAAPLSEHDTADEAELAAHAHATEHEAIASWCMTKSPHARCQVLPGG